MPTPQPPADATRPPADADRAPGGLAVAALVVGIAAFLVGLVPFLGVVVGAAAVVLGVVTVRRSARGVGTGWTFGLIGLVTGGLAVLASLVTTLLLVLGIAGLSGGPSSTVGAGPSPSATRSTPPAPPAAPSPTSPTSPAEPTLPSGGPGETVVGANGASYAVTALTCGLPTLGEGPVTATAQGEFCLADVTVTNGSSAPIRFSSLNAAAYAGATQFAADSGASISADPRAAAGPINPGQSRPGKVAFDVPAGTTLDRVTLATTSGGLVGGVLDPGVSIRLS